MGLRCSICFEEEDEEEDGEGFIIINTCRNWLDEEKEDNDTNKSLLLTDEELG